MCGEARDVVAVCLWADTQSGAEVDRLVRVGVRDHSLGQSNQGKARAVYTSRPKLGIKKQRQQLSRCWKIVFDMGG